MSNRDYESFVITMLEALSDYAKEAKQNKESAIGSEQEDFSTGYLTGFHRVITLIQQHAELYEVSLKGTGIDELTIDDLT